MMLWDIIRDFFVQYIFGGMTSNGDHFSGYVGLLEWYIDGEFEESAVDYMSSVSVPISNSGRFMQSLNLADWLSTTATIITLIALLVAISMLIVSLTKWIIRLVSLRG